jgi:hypothetical protein
VRLSEQERIPIFESRQGRAVLSSPARHAARLT